MEIIEIKGNVIEKTFYDPRTEEGRLYYDSLTIEVDEEELYRAALANAYYNNTLAAFKFEDGHIYWIVPDQHYEPKGGNGTKKIMLFPQINVFAILNYIQAKVASE